DLALEELAALRVHAAPPAGGPRPGDRHAFALDRPGRRDARRPPPRIGGREGRVVALLGRGWRLRTARRRVDPGQYPPAGQAPAGHRILIRADLRSRPPLQLTPGYSLRGGLPDVLRDG